MTLKEIRKALGLTQAEAAKRVGCCWATWARWERGEHKPHPIYARAILELGKQAEQKQGEGKRK